MIGKVTITEQDNDINKILTKVSNEYRTKPEPKITLLMRKTLSINKAKGQKVTV